MLPLGVSLYELRWIDKHTVEVKKGDKTYVVDLVNRSCSCPSYKYRKDEAFVCKHIDYLEWVV